MNRKAFTPVLPALFLPFLSLPMQGQAMTGTSHPDQATDAPSQTDHYVKPSHDTAAQSTAAPAYQDAYPATAPAPTGPAATSPEPKLYTRDGNVPATATTAAPPPSAAYAPYSGYNSSAPAQSPVLNSRVNGPDPADGQIVTEIATNPHELNRGTLLHARLREPLNTQTTPEGAVFTAELTADVGHHGEIMFPAGSLIRGHVTAIHSGKRITGGAAMHLRPETISLPDGTLYRLEAQVTDLTSSQDLRVNDEGTVVLRSNPKAAAAVIGGVTGTAAITGAVVGGGVGAAVGALAGAGVATAVYLKREVQENIPADTDVIFALNQPLTITPR